MTGLPQSSQPAQQAEPHAVGHRIGYFLWRFPILSETFIQRELAALIARDVDCMVFAEEPQDVGLLDDRACALMKRTVYLLPVTFRLRLSIWRNALLGHPRATAEVFRTVRRLEHGRIKSLKNDLRLLSYALVLAHYLDKNRIDHVHSPWANHSALVASLAAALLNIPFTVHARAYELHRHNARWALRDKFAAAEYVITNSDYNMSHVKQLLETDHHHKLRLIRNGLDLEQFEPPAQRGNARVRILSVGRRVPQKGFEHLLRACAILKQNNLVFECRIVGGAADGVYPGYQEMLEDMRQELGLANDVRFLGALAFPDVLEEYRSADIFALPCIVARDGARDVTPNCVLEAMAMKLPVVTTTVAAIPELVEHEVSGYLVEPNSDEALARRLGELISSASTRRRLGEAGRSRVEKTFDIRCTAARLIEVFSGIHVPRDKRQIEPG